jgi:glycosyltransferase 2 family protein
MTQGSSHDIASSPLPIQTLDSVQARSSRRSAWFSLLLGTLLSGIAVWLIVRDVPLNQTLAALTTSHLAYFALGFLMQLVATGFTVRRWQVLLRPYPTRFLNLVQIYFSAHLLNTILPAKLGTVARVFLAAETENTNVGFVLGSVAIEKILDTLVMLLLLAGLAFFVPMPTWIRDSLLASVVLVLGALAVLASVRQLREPLLRALVQIEMRLFGRSAPRVATFVRGLLESVTNLTQRREAFSVLLWTVCMWLAAASVNQLLFMALDLSLPWTATWFVMVALQLGTRIPALPANLGVFHYVVILALTVYGVNESAALAFAILLHLIVFFGPALIGALCALPLSARLMRLVARRAG